MIARELRWIAAGVGLGLALSALIASMVLGRTTRTAGDGPDAAFVRAVDLTPLDRAAVHAEGRVKSFDSFASEIMGYISGRKKVFNQPADFTYLDLMLRPERYEQTPLIYIKNPQVRGQIIAALSESRPLAEADAAAFRESGLIAPAVLDAPEIDALLNRLSDDVVRTAKHADAIHSALFLSKPRPLRQQLLMIPPPSGSRDDAWVSIDSLWNPDAVVASAQGAGPLVGIDAATISGLRQAWSGVVDGWQAGDAAKVNQSLATFTSLLPSVAPGLYPEPQRMLLESWYFKSANMTWVWVVYLACVALLLMAVAYRWERARLIGIGVFGVAFALHTMALGWRWYVSGRWPNSNMFEAVTTSVWLGTICVLGLEAWARRSPMRNLFMLAGAASSMCAMMAAHYVPQLNSSINNMMPVLHDLWLYIHTNVIIASYALIAGSAVTGGLYLAYRVLGGSAAYARAGGAASLFESSGDPLDGGATQRRSPGELFDGATMVLMELSFILLWAGIVMGAIWADHSWGRPWGWDPKEVFALNTFLVFLILVHVRLRARDKGLWTAILAIAGCAVMLFNWIVINFVISGLHSYA